MYPSSNRLGIQFWVSKIHFDCIMSMCEMCVFKEKKGHKQRGTKHTDTSTHTHKRWWWKMDMKKTRWHRVRHSENRFCCCCCWCCCWCSCWINSSCFWLASNLQIFGLVETPIFGHIQTYYLFIWLKHNIYIYIFFVLCVVFLLRIRFSSVYVAIFMFAQNTSGIRFNAFVNPVLFMLQRPAADVVSRYLLFLYCCWFCCCFSVCVPFLHSKSTHRTKKKRTFSICSINILRCLW